MSLFLLITRADQHNKHNKPAKHRNKHDRLNNQDCSSISLFEIAFSTSLLTAKTVNRVLLDAGRAMQLPALAY